MLEDVLELLFFDLLVEVVHLPGKLAKGTGREAMDGDAFLTQSALKKGSDAMIGVSSQPEAFHLYH